MGMAASQARFLGLTARKNNVEYEGQQINQQRTTLSNESANYYNDLLGMAVPVPPSVDDYTKTVYTFEDGALTNQITAMIVQDGVDPSGPIGTYKISYLRQWIDDFAVVSACTSIVNDSGNPTDGPFMVGAKALRLLGKLDGKEEEVSYSPKRYTFTNGAGEEIELRETNETVGLDPDDKDPGEEGDIPAYDAKVYKDGNGKEYYMFEITGDDGEPQEAWFSPDDSPKGYSALMNAAPEEKKKKVTQYETGDDEYLKTLSNDQIEALKLEELEYIKLLTNKYGEGNYMVRYIKNTTTGEYEPYFYKLQDLQGAIYDENGNSQSNIKCYKIGSETKYEEIKALPDCRVEKDSSGRYINITIPQYNEDGEVLADLPPVTYALTTQTSTDQDAYQDAMNQYEYDKALYDKAIQDINAKIEIIQSEDKNLELRLKQLDTEQKAISTEMDAVSQVIQKNTESSFKTFG